MKNLKSIIALLVLTVFSVNAFGTDPTEVLDCSALYNATTTPANGPYCTTNFSVSLAKNGAANDPAWNNTDKCLRLYATKSTSNGNTLTISTSTKGYYITGVTLTSSDKQGKPSESWTGNKSGTSVTYASSDKLQSVTMTLGETGGSKNANLNITAITISYVFIPACTAPDEELSISATSTSIALNKTTEISTNGGNGGAITYTVTTTSGTGTGSVDENGIFSATAEGTYKVTAHQNQTAGGVCAQDADVTITVGPIQFGYYVTECCTKWDAPTVEYTTPLQAGGATATPTITGTTHGEASYESSDISVLTVDNDGTIHPVGAGTATITVTWAESTEDNIDYCENQAVSNTITVTGNISVAFDAKGGEGTMENQSIPLGTPTKLNACNYTKTGYTFKGWDTDPVGATVVYGDEEEVTLFAGCTLYAVWEINSYNVTFTPSIEGQGSITVNGNSTGSVSVNYGETVTIFVTENTHYTLNTLTANASDIKEEKSFTMPDDAVEIAYSFTEAAFKMISFYNNGIQVGDPIKAYIGEAIGALPEQGIMTSCDETSTSFIGWTAEDISEKTTDKPAMLTASTVITSESATAYNALWAEGGEATMPIEIAYWAKQAMTANTPITATSGAQSEAQLTPGITLSSEGDYTYSTSNISSTPNPSFVISNIDLTSYADKDIAISFVGRNSQQKSFTVSASTDGNDYTTVGTTANNNKNEIAYTISGIPSSAKYIKITFNAESGSLYFGTIKLKALSKDPYQFEALTADNTVGWTGEDWNGMYLIAHDNTENSEVLSGYAPAEKSIFTLDKGESTLSTNDLDNAFDVTYSSTNSGYSVQGKGLGKYLSSDYGTSGALSVSDNIAYHQSVEYNLINANGTSKMYYNSGSFKFYSSTFNSITLYKLLPSSTNYITSCCEQLPAPVVEVDGEVETNKATIKWNAITGATGYQYSADQNTWTDFTLTSKVLSGLNPNTEYTYYVRATCSTGDYCTNGEVGSVTFTTKPLTVDITFNAAENGGTIDGEGTKVLQYTYNGEALTLPTPDERTGYHFNGWFTTKTGKTQVTNVGGDNKPTENKTYYAQWTQLKLYKITYNVPACVNAEPYAEGTSQYEGLSVDFEQLPENVDDWECIGWSTENPATVTTTKPEILPMQIQTGLTGNMTVYAIYQKGEELPTGEFRISATWDDETVNYIAGRSNTKYSNATATKENGKIFGVEDNQYVYFWNGETKTYLVNGSSTDLTIETNKNNLGNTAKWTVETDTEGYLLIHHTLGTSERYIAGKTVSDAKRFAAYTTGEDIYHQLTKHDIIEEQALYTTAPCLPECVLSVSGNVHLTSGKDIAVYTTTPAGNVITVSAPHIDRADYIQCTFLNESGEVDANAPFALCENTDSYAKVTNGKINTKDLTGELNRTYAISYKPSVANHIDNYTLQLKAYDDEKVEVSTCTLAVSGRSLPEQFAIVIKKDNQWYAVPNELEKTAGANIPAAIEVSVNNNTNPAYVIQDEKMSQITFHAAPHPTGITWRRGAIRLQRANAESYGFITATHTDNTSFYMPDNNADDQQLYLTSSDCNKYKVTLDPALYENNPPTRWMSIDGSKIGWYKTQACDVYFLPIYANIIDVVEGETKKLSDYNVIEETKVIVHAGGTLNADKEATIGTLQIERKDGKSGQVIETATLTANNAYFDLTLNAQGMKWYDIAVPFTVDRLHGLSFPNGGNFPLNDVLVYNGATRATNGTNGSAWQYQDDGDLVPGVGYDIMFATNVQTVRFTKKAGEKLNNEGDLAVSEFVSANPLDANWNYVANNSLHYVNLGFDDSQNSGVIAQTYNPEDDNYTAYTQGEATYLVGTPFFVQVVVEDFVVWGTTPIHDVLRAPAMTTNRVERFTLEMSANGEMTDRLFVSADENARDEYQIGKDVAKMGVSTTVAQMWINNYNTKLCANEAILYNGMATYQMGIFIPKEGEYTIAITNAPENATLYLTIDGLPIWNLSESAYVSTFTKGTHTEFGLLLQANTQSTPTNINSLNGNNKAQKIFKDQNIYILRDAKLYNAQGTELK